MLGLGWAFVERARWVVSKSRGVLVVREDTIIQGEIRRCHQIEVYGYVEGQLAADKLLVHQGGQCYGIVQTDTAEIHGTVQGDVFVKHLINIRSSGSVSGNVQYGQLAMEPGGNLSADVHNVPPTLSGDLDLSVDRGQSVRITLEDLNAVDPDDTAQDLTFSVSKPMNGFVTLASSPKRPVTRFTQADLQNGGVLFMHDGTNSQAASFDIVVADRSGATTGASQTVRVAVRG
jgi:cytoskeletal protein CcmA (bactofilin family)